MKSLKNKIICGDCIALLDEIDKPFADLVFADPPFNIGYQYDKYHDKVEKNNYLNWTEDWMKACIRILKPTGSFYIAIGDEYAANVRVIGDKLGLHLRNWIIWHYTFGQQTKAKFARSHTHIFYFVKDEKDFTFNDDEVRVLSDRQKIYNDKRANPFGKLPDDVWNEFPRVCGTFDEREGWHPCQMPESLLARIIRASTKVGNWVLDPFSGSGTTAIVASKLNRLYTGIEISPYYVEEAEKRIKNSVNQPIEGERPLKWNSHFDSELKWIYHENKITTEEFDQNEILLNLFAEKFNLRIGTISSPYHPKDILKRLVYLRKSAKLGPLQRTNKKGTVLKGEKNEQLESGRN
jgi:site-specific DNA-methyltransferase (adenine-specific)